MEVACSECEGDGASDVEALFASQEEAKPPNILAAGIGLKKSGSACSEQGGVGSSDEEALFASQKGMKRPIVLATGTGLERMEATKVYKR
ncbi:hypothetical protein [Bacillus cereus group sp. Bce001]|uniref:hypothetical protein n=1 Tax=Bacillus cereus group sp. Bce001 TaxID=3445260 RepID=UPI003F69F08C